MPKAMGEILRAPHPHSQQRRTTLKYLHILSPYHITPLPVASESLSHPPSDVFIKARSSIAPLKKQIAAGIATRNFHIPHHQHSREKQERVAK